MRRRFYSLVWHLSCAAMRFILAREHSDYDIPVLPSATQLPSSALSRTAIRAVAVRFVVVLLVGSDGPFSRVLEETYHQLTNESPYGDGRGFGCCTQVHVAKQRQRFLTNHTRRVEIQQQWIDFCANLEERRAELVKQGVRYIVSLVLPQAPP